MDNIQLNVNNRQHRLVVRIAHGHLSFSTVIDCEVVYRPYALNSSISVAANLREALRNEPLLGRPYEHVLVTLGAPVLMVPTDLFREDECEQQYRYAFTPNDQQVVCHTVLPDLNSVAVFPILKDLRTVLGDAFDNVRYTPAMGPVWRHFYQRSFTGQHQKLYAYFHERQMEVFSFAQNRFKFCNSFAVNNPNDALYYVLAVWKQLGMTPNIDELHLAGDVPEREVLTDEATKFVKRVFFANPSGEFNRAPVTQIEGIPYDLMVLYIKGR
jgi:hypothetical protein